MTLDSLEECVVVLDACGMAIAANAALVDFARDNPCCDLRLGVNYLDACERRGARDPDRAAIAECLREMLAGERSGFTLRYALDPCAQPLRWFGVRATPFRGDGPVRIVMQHYDSTTFVETQRAERLRTRLLDEIDAAVIAGDLEGRVELWSRGAEKLFGWTADEAIGHNVSDVIVVADDRSASSAGLAELKREGARLTERTLRHKNGTHFAGYASSAVYSDDTGTPCGLISVIVDATERVQAAQELLEARDHLRAVTDSIGEAVLTLDDAGHVSYMNAAAERLLGWPVDEMRGHTLHELTHVRRPDGSTCPVEECPLYGAHEARASVRVEDDMFIRRDGSGLAVSWVLEPFESPAGKNSVIVFTDNTQAKLAQQALQLEIDELSQLRDVHEALQEERFELFAQPIINVATHAVVSHELLLRMRERDGAIRMPGSFLPAAERGGLIGELDRWVIRQAARLAGEGHQVEVNVSAASIGDPGLYDDFADALAEHGADPACIVVELTETAIMQEDEAAGSFIERVCALGCEVALDDFGTGFGGFGYLKRLPVDYLKIDVEFVRDIRTNTASRHVVQAVVGLAAAFGHRTIAEGVEDAETLEMIREMGVDLAQGYGIGRPAPLAETLYGQDGGD